MFNEFEDYEYEPSLVDEIKEEATRKLFDAIDESIRQKFDNVVAENSRLKEEIKEVYEKLRGVTMREKNLAVKEAELSRKAKKMPLKEIMGQREIIMYCARTEYKDKEKCSKCDENRKLVFTSPRGRSMEETCECGEDIKYFAPNEQVAYEIAYGKESLRMWYRPIRDSDSYSSGRFVADENVFGELKDYSKLDMYNSFFVSKEDCQKYCDWLNSKQV